MQSTRWTLIQRAGREDDVGRRALEELCAIYWPGVYEFLRQKCGDSEKARDLTQGFFLDLLSRGDLATIQPGKGRFRSFLFKASQNFAAKERDRESAQKRGGGQVPVFLSELDGEFLPEPRATETPEAAYDRAWAQALVNQSLMRLRDEQVAKGKGELHDRLLPWLQAEGLPGGYKALAEEIGKSEGALKVAVFRMRERFRELLLLEVGQTLGDGEDPLQELRELLAALS